MQKTYIAIDLKSFYASAECVARGLDPLTTNLVVADESRTDKTICLAVTPSLKAFGIPGRARLFEVKQRLREVNAKRPKSQQVTFIAAPPRMGYYMQVSGQVFNVYLKYVAPEDIHPYSVDEVFIDATDYLRLYKLSAHEFAMRMIRDVLATTGITATAGIGPNLYLAKIAMDIEAKHQEADADGVRIAELDELSYRRKYWNHRPLTDFWRIGRGIAARLETAGLFTLGDVARCSLGRGYGRYSEDFLYKLLGVNAELLIDHAWGWEPCTMEDIKAYRPSTNSLSRGQVLSRPYTCAEAKVITKEMTESLVMELVAKKLLTDHITLDIVYDTASLEEPGKFKGTVTTDFYGRAIPKPSHGSSQLGRHSSSTALIRKEMVEIFDRIADPGLLVRRIYIGFGNTVPEDKVEGEQLFLFQDNSPADEDRERRRQEAILAIRRKYGKNAILKGTNFDEGATAIERNKQVGGHRQ
ncbi:MAG: DNA methylase [Bacteroidales bacterium]|nr:DNA methylase [Bacteroidales bacterium]